MAQRRLVVTGPKSSASTRALIDRPEFSQARLWIVPGPLAQRCLRRQLADAGRVWTRVLTWTELWEETARLLPEPPAPRISAPANAVFVDEAVRRARQDGALIQLAALIDRPGYRRVLDSRFARWNREEVDLLAELVFDDPVETELFAVYRHWRALLDEIGVSDASSFANWASRGWSEANSLLDDAFADVAILDLERPQVRERRVIDHLARFGRSLVIRVPTLADDPGSLKIVSEWEARGFLVEALVATPPSEQVASLELDSDLEDESRPLVARNVRILGGPGAEGQARLIAAELRERAPASTGWTVVLVPGWNDQTREIVARLQDFGVPVAAPPPLSLATSPAVNALLRAARLPEAGWPAVEVAELCRHGALAPAWASSWELARAGHLVGDLAPMRGAQAIRSALVASTSARNPERDAQALSAFDNLTLSIPDVGQATFAAHTMRLGRLAIKLGLQSEGEAAAAIETLTIALEDVRDALDVLGRGEDVITRADFISQVERIIQSERLPRQDQDGSEIAVATIDEYEGVDADTLVVVNLVEGSFPPEDAIKAEVVGESAGEPSAYARSLRRFRRLLGSVSERLILAYPCVDDKGEELLPAGFLNLLLRRVPKGDRSIFRKQTRLDPTLRGRADLVFTRNDRRVLAMAEALIENEPARLDQLAMIPAERGPLLGAAAGLRLTHERFRVEDFGPHEGLLNQERVSAVIRSRFGPESVFSASQLESYVWCPFQFFLKYVLALAPGGERGELEGDPARFGSRLHDILQRAHQVLQPGGDALTAPLADQIKIATKTEMSVVLSDVTDDALSRSLLEIERQQVERLLEKYADDYDRYLQSDGAGAVPSAFELSFGMRDATHPGEYLKIGSGATQIKLQGKIDRVDLVNKGDGTRFRVIDYKAMSVPSNSDVTKHRIYVQLPLYALAVQRLGLLKHATDGIEDAGYWGLSKDGFVRLKLQNKGATWDELIASVESHLEEAVARLRSGVFTVSPKKPDCSRACDFSSACRIGEVRRAGKGPTSGDDGGPIAEADQPHTQARG